MNYYKLELIEDNILLTVMENGNAGELQTIKFHKDLVSYVDLYIRKMIKQCNEYAAKAKEYSDIFDATFNKSVEDVFDIGCQYHFETNDKDKTGLFIDIVKDVEPDTCYVFVMSNEDEAYKFLDNLNTCYSTGETIEVQADD